MLAPFLHPSEAIRSLVTATSTLALIGLTATANAAPMPSFTAVALSPAAGSLSPARGVSEGSDAPSWIDTTLDVDTLTDVAPEYVDTLREHLGRYEDWIRANEYHVARSKDARVLLVTKSEKVSKRRMKLVEKTLDAFDDLMSPPDRAGSDETFQPAAWGAGDHVPDAEPIVLIEVDGSTQYSALLDDLGDEDPTLSSWARSHASQPGFAEGRFAVAAWQSAPDGFELGDVWRPENELVNRLARLAIHRSYGPQPTWLSVAGSWRIEMSVMKSIYCFPYRREFVGIGEHKGWKPMVRSLFKKRKKEPLRFDEFASWQRNTWDANQSAIAWAFVEFLAECRPGALGQAAESYRKIYKDGYRTTFPDGTWRTDPSFQVPVDEQQSVLTGVVGDELLDEVTGYFRTWKKPRKRR